MTHWIIHIFDLLKKRKAAGLTLLLLLTLLLAALLMRQSFKEDISDFLPLEGRSQQAMEVYKDMAGTDRIFAVVQMAGQNQPDADLMTEAVDMLESALEETDTAHWLTDVTSQVDMEQIEELTDFAYSNIPYFLSDSDYVEIWKKLAEPEYVEHQLEADKQMLMFPVSGLLADNMQRDPLNIFTPLVTRLQAARQQLDYEIYNGYIFSPDMTKAYVMMRSPFGASETANNSQLVELLKLAADKVKGEMKEVDVHFTGGPVIAVGNAERIRTDSLVAVSLAVVLILLLLFYTLRSIRNILLILLSIGWGCLFAMGMLSLVNDNVSIIVIGIASAIVGIAVNYPLHFIAHLNHTPERRSALKEICGPLVVGNITTVGAFLALVPLHSVALRDLGLFSALLLVGTILFVLFCLPHMAHVSEKQHKTNFIDRAGNLSLESNRWVGWLVVAVTAVLLFFSFHTQFDADISHMNYMTDEQRKDMADLQKMTQNADSLTTIYAVSYGADAEEAVARAYGMRKTYDSCLSSGIIADYRKTTDFIVPGGEQQRRLMLWKSFVEEFGTDMKTQVGIAARKYGFSDHSFDEFWELIDASFEPQDIAYFDPLMKTVYTGFLVDGNAEKGCKAVDVLYARKSDVKKVEELLEDEISKGVVFDVGSMTSAVADALSDNFNYIGWACGIIVFCFLWFSFGNLELAILSFIPMAVSWIWILGMMSILGIQFNVVNVILATFIFGQGDDYTIFMTEGCQYEYAYRRKMLASYKSSIILSALIMFVGIGTLIIAKHPALRSLAELTIVGMFSVVLMAYLFPPLIFRWMVSKDNAYRIRPLSFRMLWERLRGCKSLEQKERTELKVEEVCTLIMDRYRYKGSEVMREVRSSLCANASLIEEMTADSPEMVVMQNSRWGALALALAYACPDSHFVTFEKEPDKVLLATYSAQHFVENIDIRQQNGLEDVEELLKIHPNAKLIIAGPKEEERTQFKTYKPVIVK